MKFKSLIQILEKLPHLNNRPQRLQQMQCTLVDWLLLGF